MMSSGFLLREDANDIGRASNMHVVLADEPTVSRNRHACITFDSEKGIFTLYVDLDRQDVFCNGVPVKGSCELENRALIQIGECVLSFMAFCDVSFTWYTTEG